MLEADHVINLVWPVRMVFMQKAIFAPELGTNRSAAKIIRDFRTQAGGSGGPGL
jgi:hypothetical protein